MNMSFWQKLFIVTVFSLTSGPVVGMTAAHIHNLGYPVLGLLFLIFGCVGILAFILFLSIAIKVQ